MPSFAFPLAAPVRSVPIRLFSIKTPDRFWNTKRPLSGNLVIARPRTATSLAPMFNPSPVAPIAAPSISTTGRPS